MKLYYYIILLLLIPIVTATDLMNQSKYHPKLSNVTYVLQQNFLGLSRAEVNDTCFTMNQTSFCNVSLGLSELNISGFTDTIAPSISNLRNTSTTNQSSFIQWSCDENCNYTLNWYNESFLSWVGSIANSTFSLNHAPLLSSLTNSTTYLINLTVCDSSANCRSDTTFNFTTAANPAIIVTPVSGGGGGVTGGGGGCDILALENQKCYFVNDKIECQEGCPQGYYCDTINFKCMIESVSEQIISTCNKDISIWDRLFSTCKDPVNKVCDDGEMPIINLDCNPSVNKLTSNDIFYEIWLLRLMIVLTLILFLLNSKDYVFFVFLDAVLLSFNNAFTMTPLIPDTTIGPAVAQCSIKNIGACLWKSNPRIGWAILFGVLFLMAYVIGRNQVKRRLKKKDEKLKKKLITFDVWVLRLFILAISIILLGGMVNLLSNAKCTSSFYNIGSCIWKSDPMIGWGIITLILLMFYLLRRDHVLKKKEQEKTTDKLQ